MHSALVAGSFILILLAPCLVAMRVQATPDEEI